MEETNETSGTATATATTKRWLQGGGMLTSNGFFRTPTQLLLCILTANGFGEDSASPRCAFMVAVGWGICKVHENIPKIATDRNIPQTNERRGKTEPTT
jgi:hypothetical protein